MNTLCHISGLGSFIPENILTNRELESMVETSDEWIVSRTGIKERHILNKGDNTSDAATEAARAALADAGLEPSAVTHIFVATCTPDNLCPSTACLVAGKLGINAATQPGLGQVMCLDFNAACSGFLYGLELARATMALHPEAVILLIGAEALSRRMNYSDRSTCVLFGDGAGAVVLQTGGTSLWDVRDVTCLADGSRNDLICVGGGSSMMVQPGDVVPDDFFLTMNGREVFRLAVRTMTKSSKDLLARNGMGVDDVDLFIAHQANMRIIEAVGERMAIDPAKVFINVQNYGNTSAATLPLAMQDARSQGVLRPGMKVLLTTFGGGITWGAALLGS